MTADVLKAFSSSGQPDNVSLHVASLSCSSSSLLPAACLQSLLLYTAEQPISLRTLARTYARTHDAFECGYRGSSCSEREKKKAKVHDRLPVTSCFWIAEATAEEMAEVHYTVEYPIAQNLPKKMTYTLIHSFHRPLPSPPPFFLSSTCMENVRNDQCQAGRLASRVSSM